MEYKIGKQDFSVCDGEFHWENVDIQKYRIDHPVVVCFGGNGTVEEKDSIAIAKGVKRLIGSEDEVDILSIAYSHANGMTWGYLSTKEEVAIVQNLLLPLVMDEQGNRLPFDEARKRARRLTLVGHCAGAREFIPDLNNIFVQGLAMFGFNKEEILGITEQILVVGYVGTGKVMEMSYVNFKSIYDGLYGKEYIQELLTFEQEDCQMKEEDRYRLLGLREEIYYNNQNALAIAERFMQKQGHMLMKCDNSVNIYTSKVAVDLSDHHFDSIDRKENWRPQAILTKLGDRVSQAMAYSIAYSVANSINNEESDEFIPLNLTELANHLDDILTSDYARAKKAQENGRNRF